MQGGAHNFVVVIFGKDPSADCREKQRRPGVKVESVVKAYSEGCGDHKQVLKVPNRSSPIVCFVHQIVLKDESKLINVPPLQEK